MITEGQDLYPLNTFKVQARARYFTPLRQIEALKKIRDFACLKKIPHLVLGGGSNILFTEDFPGLVIHNQIQGITTLEESSDAIVLRAGAGVVFDALVAYSVRHRYGGLENLSSIPGSVGAAPIQNIGAYGVEIAEHIRGVHYFDWQQAAVKYLPGKDCRFGYRDSIFKHELQHALILWVDIQLYKKPVFKLHYKGLKDYFNQKPPSLALIRERIQAIRSEKLPPPHIGSAGSFFKNPVISLRQYELLKNAHPDLPCFPADTPDKMKIPAGFLIEACGKKGYRQGDISCFHKQALIITNEKERQDGRLIRAFAQDIQHTVAQKWSVHLAFEVCII